MGNAIGHLHPSPHLSIVRIIGELDLDTAPILRAALTSAAADPTHEFAVELSAVTFMDCAGLSPLVEAHVRLGRRLRLCDPSQAVSRLLYLTGLDATFAIDGATSGVCAGAAVEPTEDHVRPGDGSRRTHPRGTPVEARVPVHAEEHTGLGVLEAHLAGPGAALGNRVVIEEARGMLMASLDCDATQASHALLQISWNRGTTVLDAALALIAHHSRAHTETTELVATDSGRATHEGATVGS